MTTEECKQKSMEMIGLNWQGITTASKLKQVIECVIRVLRDGKFHDLADDWTSRLCNMPSKMSKESINVVLLAATFELKRYFENL